MDKSYPIKIGGSEYIVSGFGDRLGTPPSARGFNLKTFSLGLKKYETVYQATEENGYAFIIYADGDKKLILKGGQGSDHKETVMASSKELQSIRKEKYADQDDMNFLRKTCLSGRAWLVPLKGKNYYFVGIWNTSITQNQYDVLKEYLTKFPASATYIQMGMAGTGPSSEFQLLSGFSPKIVSDKPKLSNKEKEFVRTAHMRASELPAGYAKQLQKLRNMTEADTFMSNYQAYETYKNYALKMIPKLERIKSLGKAKTAARDIVTQSSVESILMGLGKNYPELTKKLQSLLKYSYHYSELVKLHNKGKIDSTNWRDPSMDGVINENAEMAKSDLTKLVDYSEKLQSMFDVNDNLEDWVKAKLNHSADYVATVRDYLKFYRDEKGAGTSEDQIDEKWSMKYKKSIDCNNPKGFGQKAHCRARQLRKAGKHTNSKPVREIYKEVTNQLLKEFDSSMAMGALKQINSDAKELQSMLQQDTKLEDWVKAKLNLAGEYLDDVYHHLDHFGPEGRKLDEVRIARELEEGWKDWVAAGAIGLGALSGSPALAAKQAVKPAITKSVTKGSEASLLNKKTSDYIGQWEGKRNAMYLDTEKKPTIGIGHYLNNTQQDRDLFKALFGNVVNYDDVLKGKQKLTDDQIEKLFNVDVKVKEKMASSKISNFTSLPQYVKNAVINAFYRGDMGPKTVKLMNSGNWGAAAKEYLNHQNARSGPDQIQRRMKTNALAFAQFAKNQSEYFGFNYAIG
jgi:GH24 family phage-related lysozyme (muramidase)